MNDNCATVAGPSRGDYKNPGYFAYTCDSIIDFMIRTTRFARGFRRWSRICRVGSRLMAIATIVLAAWSSFAADAIPRYRVWTTADGNTLMATYRGQLGEDIFLSTPSNKYYQVSLQSLSAEDRKYLSSATTGRDVLTGLRDGLALYSNIAHNAAQREELMNMIRDTPTRASTIREHATSLLKSVDLSPDKWQGCCSDHDGLLIEDGRVVLDAHGFVMCKDGQRSPTCNVSNR